MDALDWGAASEQCLRVARHCSRDSSEAEDIAQEALLRAWRHHRAGNSVEKANAWLGTITRNEAARSFSRLRPEPRATLINEVAEDDCNLTKTALRIDVTRGLADLEEIDRRLLWLRYGEDLTQPAIARVLGLPEGTVKVRLHRARLKLRRVLEQP